MTPNRATMVTPLPMSRKLNLREALADSIQDCANDGSFSTGLGRLSVALRALADEIDAARQKSNVAGNRINPVRRRNSG